jgi:predicted MPP superfamily phosphohydrolase
MRIIVTSDTHYHAEWQQRLAAFVGEIAALKPDAVILAGDVGEGLGGFGGMLDLLQPLDCPRLIVAGNHDLWADRQASSEARWTEILPRLTREHGAIWLEADNWCKDGLGICGTIGWYDYTARDPSLPVTDADYAMMKQLYNVDGLRIDWHYTDIDFANRVGEAFAARLAALDADPAIREILVVSHVPAFEVAMVRKPGNKTWNFSNAYFGNLTLGKRIVASSKVTRVVSGHTHVGINAQVGAIEVRVIPSDYGSPAYVVLDYPPT